jgi:predicted transposase YbfD/YdcC
VLGRQACAAQSNEITPIPLLLERMASQGALVTIRAMGCQTRIALTIRDRRADHLPAVKQNWPSLHAEVERDGKTTREWRFYLSSLKLDADLFAHAVRSHWQVENCLHGCSTSCSMKTSAGCAPGAGRRTWPPSATSRSTCRRGATDRHSLEARRKSAGWDVDYLDTILRRSAPDRSSNPTDERVCQLFAGRANPSRGPR